MPSNSKLYPQWKSLKKAFEESPNRELASELTEALALESSLKSKRGIWSVWERRFNVLSGVAMSAAIFLLILEFFAEAYLGIDRLDTIILIVLGVAGLAVAFFISSAFIEMQVSFFERFLLEITPYTQLLSSNSDLCKEALSLVDAHPEAAALRNAVVNRGEALRGCHLFSMRKIASKEAEAQSMSYCRKLHLIPDAAV